MEKTKKHIALVIGSGGVKCAAAVGMWRVLQEEQIEIHSLVGTSGGSLYCAHIAKGADGVEMDQLSKGLWTSDLMKGYTANLKAAKDGSLRFNERSGLVNDI